MSLRQPEPADLPPDGRLYVPECQEWSACIKTDWDKSYCFAKNPNEDYYHLILNGEIFLQRGDEQYCLRCAVRMGIATTNRLFWQSRREAPNRGFV